MSRVIGANRARVGRHLVVNMTPQQESYDVLRAAAVGMATLSLSKSK